MTMRLSTGLRNFLANGGGLAQALNNGRMEIYSGAQPTSPDAAVTGTLLCTITAGGAAITNETLATGTVTLSGSSGSVNTITVNGVNIISAAVPFNGTLTQTALDLATAINNNMSAPEYTATASGATVTISAARGTGASPNGFVVTGTLTTLTATYANMAGGVNAANGLQWGAASGGQIAIRPGQTWSGTNAATGTAGYFRLYGSTSDAGALDSAGTQLRMDGAISSSGAELNFNSTAFVSGATTTIPTFTATVPAQ